MEKNIKMSIGRCRLLILGGLVLSSLTTGCSSRIDLIRNEPPGGPVAPPVVSAVASPATTGSLWPGENARNLLFVDNRARQVNDIVTVLVSETSDGSSKASTNTSRDTSTTAGVAALLGLEKSLQNSNENLKPKIEMGGSASNSLKGQGDTSRKTKLSTSLTARVLQVLENGNLLIEGRRQLTMNGEDQYIVVSGIIRTDDIGANNTIASQFIADAKIYYAGDGVINEKMRPGWLTRIMDAVWPF